MKRRRVNALISIVLGLTAAVAWGYALFKVVIRDEWAVRPGVLPLCIALTAAACFGWLLTVLDRGDWDGQTRCRSCGHILRGLSQPRCPECGEAI